MSLWIGQLSIKNMSSVLQGDNRNRISSVGRALDCMKSGKVTGSLPGVGPILRVLKGLRNEETSCLCPRKVFTPLRGLDDRVQWGPVSNKIPKHGVLNKYFHAKFIDTQIKCIFKGQLRTYFIKLLRSSNSPSKWTDSTPCVPSWAW